MVISSICLNRLGLVLNVIGSLLIALAIGKNLEEAHQIDQNGKKIYLAVVKSSFNFKLGITLIIIGFIFQVLATF